MKYLRFDPTDCGFPKPRVPILPGLTRHSLELKGSGPAGTQRQGADIRHFTRGRYALTQAYAQSGVGPQGALLAPAYHCRTMLDAAIRLGANVALYAVNPDLSPDMDSLTACVNATQPPVKALLVPHYFGFPQNLAPLVEFCAQHGLTLIEDCSHAFVGPVEDPHREKGTMGSTGRFCVSSPYKFFPSQDGGLLWANVGSGLKDFEQTRAGLQQEIRGLAHTLQKTLTSVSPPDIRGLEDEVSALASAPVKAGLAIEEQNENTSDHYVLAEEKMQSLASSRWIFRHTDTATLVSRRRENYQAWLAGIAKLPFCRALFPQIPDGCVPYMFPLQLDRPEIHFYALKRLGVPIWRWDDMAASGCKVASEFRLKLLHLPCHQGLSSRQMAWMIAAVTQVMSQGPAGLRS